MAPLSPRAPPMTQVRTIVAGVDTPNDDGPPSILAAMGVPPLAEEERHGGAARVLFLPSFHPEVCLTIEQDGDEALLSLVTLARASLDGLGGPNRWEEMQVVPAERLAAFLRAVAALRPQDQRSSLGGGRDGLLAFCQHRSPAGSIHQFESWHDDPEHPRARFVREVYQLAVELLHEEPSQQCLESLHGYLGQGLPVKHLPGRPYVVRIFGRLTASNRSALEASLAEVPPEVPLLLDLSNLDGMGTLLHPAFRDLLRRVAPTVCWAPGDQARIQLAAIGVPAGAIFATREEALAASSGAS
jgi:hypothetical protein